MKHLLVLIGISFLSVSAVSQKNMIGEKAPEIEVNNWIYPKNKVENFQINPVPKDLNGKPTVQR